MIQSPTAVVRASLADGALRRYDLPNPADPLDFWYPIGAAADGFVFGRQFRRDGQGLTVLVTLSADGPRDGLLVPDGPLSDNSPPTAVVRIPGV